METEQHLFYYMHVGTITLYLSLTLCGQLGSSNHTALFILSYTKDLSLALFIIDPIVFMYDSALLFLVICVKCYIGPCGVLVPTGTAHSIMNLNLNLFNTSTSHTGTDRYPVCVRHRQDIYQFLYVTLPVFTMSHTGPDKTLVCDSLC